MKTILTIAGFDPSSGAGLTADLMTFASFGCFGLACATALTVQSTTGVRAFEPVSAVFLTETLQCLEEDLRIDGVKIGMLATAENVLAVSTFLAELRTRTGKVPVVLDPVLRSTSGRELLSVEGLSMLREKLLPLVDWVTPNLKELELLAGIPVATRVAMEAGARHLQEHYQTLGIVAKGGHLEDAADDLVLELGAQVNWLPGERVASRSTHGTGCAFSSAMACGLAHGERAVEAALKAKEFVREGIARATPMGAGNGPMNLLWPLRK